MRVRCAGLGRFLPAAVVYMVWLNVVTSYPGRIVELLRFWPASVAMILGSFVAGATPLGGGVVAFPVSVLVLQFSAAESRDASVLVQAVGMNAASYLILTSKKRQLLDIHMGILFVVIGTAGALVGLYIEVDARTASLIYTVLVFEFAICFFYRNQFLRQGEPPASQKKYSLKHSSLFLITLGSCMAFLGGVLSAVIGMGSDIALYAFGVLVWNPSVKEHRRFGDNELTATSVVVMGAISAIIAVSRVLTPPADPYSCTVIAPRVLKSWGAMVPVVVIGAPCGSLILTRRCLPYLRHLFYLLSTFQFTMFGVLKIGARWPEWVGVLGITFLNFVGLVCHYTLYGRSRRFRHPNIPVVASGSSCKKTTGSTPGARESASPSMVVI